MDSLNFAPPLRPKLPTSGSRATAHRGSIGSGGRRTLADVDSSPVSWRQYWNSCDDVKVRGADGEGADEFRVYRRGSEGPLLILLHGGGYSALTWSLVVEEVCSEVPQCQVLAFDQRGHGSTKTQDPSNMSATSLARDVGRVLDAVMPVVEVPVVLVGHSMGGAVAVHAEFEQHLSVQVAGLVVIDVVEGTALAALSAMHSVLAARPASFASLQEAVLWSYRSGQTRNLDAARVSMPGQVRNSNTGLCGADEVDTLQHRKNSETLSSTSDSEEKPTATDAAAGASSLPPVAVDGVAPLATAGRYSARRLSCRRLSVDNENKIEEEEEDSENKKDDKEEDGDRRRKALHNEEFRKSFESKRLKSVCGASTSSGVEGGCYKWSINLASTTEHWNSWFEGLSQRFLSVAPPKLLLLAGVDRLDTDLTVGQMQGKFQMQVVGRCGHAVHEDAPEEVAAALIAFLTRHRVLQPKNPQRFRALPGC